MADELFKKLRDRVQAYFQGRELDAVLASDTDRCRAITRVFS